MTVTAAAYVTDTIDFHEFAVRATAADKTTPEHLPLGMMDPCCA